MSHAVRKKQRPVLASVPWFSPEGPFCVNAILAIYQEFTAGGFPRHPAQATLDLLDIQHQGNVHGGQLAH